MSETKHQIECEEVGREDEEFTKDAIRKYLEEVLGLTVSIIKGPKNLDDKK